jgi:putative flavoprotein involved in K+ transport
MHDGSHHPTRNKDPQGEHQMSNQNYDTIVIGGGQAGLATGYYLQKQGVNFIILDASQRIGDSWRNRWDSLQLFTPARYSGLPGMPFPAPPHSFPTKDDMADYLEAYAAEYHLPVQNRTRVDRLYRENGSFIVRAGERQLKADNIVVAMSNWQKPNVPAFASELDETIVQMHSSEYKNLSQLRDGDVLVVGAGNSGAEIALETARTHQTWLSGRDVGSVPFRLETFASRHFLIPFVLRFLFHRIMTVGTPVGRKVRNKLLNQGMTLVRTKPDDIDAAGIERLPRVESARDGLPVFEDGRTLEVANIIWSTGFNSGFSSWIDLPIFNEQGFPIHNCGVVDTQPGLYFVGLHFLYAISSAQIHGVGRDAKRIVNEIAARSAQQAPAVEAVQLASG